jgi:hypothetical protein
VCCAELSCHFFCTGTGLVKTEILCRKFKQELGLNIDVVVVVEVNCRISALNISVLHKDKPIMFNCTAQGFCKQTIVLWKSSERNPSTTDLSNA